MAPPGKSIIRRFRENPDFFVFIIDLSCAETSFNGERAEAMSAVIWPPQHCTGCVRTTRQWILARLPATQEV